MQFNLAPSKLYVASPPQSYWLVNLQ